MTTAELTGKVALGIAQHTHKHTHTLIERYT